MPMPRFQIPASKTILCARCGVSVEISVKASRALYCPSCRKIVHAESTKRSDEKRVRADWYHTGKRCSCCGVYPVGDGLHFLCNRCFEADGNDWIAEKDRDYQERKHYRQTMEGVER